MVKLVTVSFPVNLSLFPPKQYRDSKVSPRQVWLPQPLVSFGPEDEG